VATVAVKRLGEAIRCAVKPTVGLVPGLVSDLTRTRTELLTENALLRQQLIVLRRCAKRPKFRRHERGIIVLLASITRCWRETVLLVKPETILRWHRCGREPADSPAEVKPTGEHSLGSRSSAVGSELVDVVEEPRRPDLGR
jgi:hypothetical protein